MDFDEFDFAIFFIILDVFIIIIETRNGITKMSNSTYRQIPRKLPIEDYPHRQAWKKNNSVSKVICTKNNSGNHTMTQQITTEAEVRVGHSRNFPSQD